jgi:hypothetical protein
VHVVKTRVRSLYRSQVVMVRRSLDAPLAQARYWASSDLEASPERLLLPIATRWDIEVLFGDGKEHLGWDHCAPRCAITASSGKRATHNRK